MLGHILDRREARLKDRRSDADEGLFARASKNQPMICPMQFCSPYSPNSLPFRSDSP
jgi:hypothetical protein